MKCPDSTDGVHHIGSNTKCTCGYVLRIPPVSIGIEVFEKQREVYSDHFNCDTIDGAIGGLKRALDALKALR